MGGGVKMEICTRRFLNFRNFTIDCICPPFKMRVYCYEITAETHTYTRYYANTIHKLRCLDDSNFCKSHNKCKWF